MLHRMVTLGALALSVSAQSDSELAAGFSIALNAKLSDVEPLDRELPPTAIRSIAEATGSAAEEVDDGRYWRVAFSLERPRISGSAIVCRRACAIDGHDVLLLVGDDRTIHGAAIVDTELRPHRDWRRFCAQIMNRTIPSLGEAITLEEFGRRLERVSRSKADEDRVTAALVRQRETMVGILEPFARFADLLQREGDLDEASIDLVVERFDRFAELAEPLRPLLGDAAADYRRHARAAAKQFRELKTAIANGEDHLPLIRQSQANCTKCHSLKGPGLDARLQLAAPKLRAERGVGNGLFALGYDLIAMADDREAMRAVARDLRTATLMVDAHPAMKR